jgi:predicted lipoprotein with Yx(FWY)xxD motif
MIRSRSFTVPAAAAAVLVLVVAVSVATASPEATSSRTATVKVAQRSVGKILVDSEGRTLYLFRKDSRNKSACFDLCADNWPPLRVSGTPKAGRGVRAGLLGSIKRSDGKRQVTYNGHPLYRFVGDAGAGDVNGQGLSAFGARWYVVSPSGKARTRAATGGGGIY